MLDDEFNKQRASLVRDLASRADPFIKRRLLDLATLYEKRPVKTKPLAPISISGQHPSEDKRGYPYKRSHLVALRPTKISATDPPSHWWPGER